MGPCLCLAIINLVPLIGTCSGFEVLSKSCDCGQQYTQSALDPPPYGKYPGGIQGILDVDVPEVVGVLSS